MKKLILSVLVLFVVSSINAADKKQSALSEDKIGYTVRESSLNPVSYAALEEENVQLRLKTAELANQFDELKSKFDYNEMMHITLVNLQLQEIVESAENAKIQMDYAGMMTATLFNLSNLAD